MNLMYFFSIPFVSAFNFSEVLILPLLFAMTAVSVQLITKNNNKITIITIDRFILLFLATVLISMFVNIFTFTQKNINHLFAIFSPYIFFYFGMENIVRKLGTVKILSVLHMSYIAATTFCILEFYLVNFTGFDLNSVVYRPAVTDYTPAFLDIGFTRSRSFFEESGYFAGYLAVMLPIMVYYLWHVRQSYILRIIFIALTILSAFMAFSVSLFIFLPFTILITMLLNSFVNRKFSKKMLLGYTLFLLVAITVLSSDFLLQALFFNKFEGDSFNDRNDKFGITLDVMLNSGVLNTLFGFGPGSYSNLNVLPAISVYLNFLRDIGVVGLTAYLLLTFYLLIEFFRKKTPFGTALFMSTCLMQLFFISTPIYYYPHYFLPLVFFKLMTVKNQSGKILSKQYSPIIS